MSNNTTATYSKLKVGASDIFKAGKSATALTISPGTNTTLGYGESKTVTAQIKDGNTELKKTSVVITAPAKPTIVLGITPGTKTLGYGESQTVTATVEENGVEVKRGTATITAPAAVTLDSLTFGSPDFVDDKHTSISATAEASNGEIITNSVTIDVTAHYNKGVNYANSLYSAVNVTPISTAHRVSYVSFTRQGTGKSPKPKVLYNSAGQSVTVYDVGSAATVYSKGTKVEYYTVSGFTGTVLYEAGTQKTYYTKS